MITYCHDTRTLQTGQYYVAIRGERFDGHRFIPEAIAKGAAGLVVERDRADLPTIPDELEVILVPDSTRYLAEQANQRLSELGCDVVAITGSVGKTTTKRAIVTVLQQQFDIVTPQGNWNTLLGLSLTVLNELTCPQQKFVTEIGIYHAGEISEICRYIVPTVGVILNVQPVHLESLGTIENIAQAKGELAECVAPTGVVCLNYDDPLVRAMRTRCRGRVLFWGSNPPAQITPDRITAEIPLLGTYKTTTALAVWSVADCFGMADAQINGGLTQLTPEKGRLVQLAGRNGSTLIDDTYNASLSSSLAALDVLRSQPAIRRIAVLGDMLELGSVEHDSHCLVLTHARQSADLIVLVGPRFTRAAATLDVAAAGNVIVFADTRALAAVLSNDKPFVPQSGDLILCKGSAGMRIEQIVAYLLDPALDPKALLVRQEANWQ